LAIFRRKILTSSWKRRMSKKSSGQVEVETGTTF
jgi:hypothetical protein